MLANPTTGSSSQADPTSALLPREILVDWLYNNGYSTRVELHGQLEEPLDLASQKTYKGWGFSLISVY